MKFITIFFLTITFGYAIQAQDIYEVKFTAGITQYRCALVLYEDGTGKMRCRYFTEGATRMVEQKIEIENTLDGMRFRGSDPVYPGTSTPYDYSPDIFYLSVDEYGNSSLINRDAQGIEANAYIRQIEGSYAIKIFLDEFNWKLRASSNQSQIYFENKCNDKLQLAVRYLNNDEVWITEYWYSIDAFTGTYLLSDGLRLKTNNSIVYIYAEIPGGNYTWSGDKSKYFDGQYYNMIEYKMTIDSDGDYYICLNCSNRE